MQQSDKEKSSVAHKVLSVVGIVLCIILLPILIINITLIIKSYVNTDDVPKVGGYCPLIVLTDSMYPEIKKGDLIFCKTADAQTVKEGDVISFFDPDGNGSSVVTHRVVEVTQENGQTAFRTKGDANNSEDRSLVTEDKLVGLYMVKISGAGNVAMFMQTTTGLIVCVVVPLILLVLYDFIRRRIYEKSGGQSTSELLAELEQLKAEKAEREKTADVSEETDSKKQDGN